MAVLLGRVDGGHNLYCLLLASHGLLLVHSYSAIQLGGIEKRPVFLCSNFLLLPFDYWLACDFVVAWAGYDVKLQK